VSLRAPASGVEPRPGGLFDRFMRGNVEYLLNSFSVDEMLYPFRIRAGVPDPPRERPIDGLFDFWCRDLLGSEAGRFLMGAGNTLRWMEHAELRRRVHRVVDGIGACQEPDGYCYAFARRRMRHFEEGNYARCWFTQGLLDAGAVHAAAYGIARRGHDWFNACECLPQLIYMQLGYQGHTASTQMYFSPVGRPEDLRVAEKYYVQDWWMDRLIAGDAEALWRYPLNRPHCYCLTAFEAYLDHYLATGERKMLDAVLAVWRMFRENWRHVGGAMAMCELRPYPPKTWRLACTGELCGSVFWVLLNHRLHRLFPEEEQYVAEIEQSLYNVLFANHRREGIRYHALLDGRKEPPNSKNTCCEVHGARLCGMLPQFIYSTGEDGVTVNLFEASSIRGVCRGIPYRLALETAFPESSAVEITMERAHPGLTLRVRVPGWAVGEMDIRVNGTRAAAGRPGSYAAIGRAWAAGDRVSFVLPAALRMEPYLGIDQPYFNKRHALLYGPVLLAACGPERAWEGFTGVMLDCNQTELLDRLRPVDGSPLRYTIEGEPGHGFKPYWCVEGESFSAVPIFRKRNEPPAWAVALAQAEAPQDRLIARANREEANAAGRPGAAQGERT
jgi:hypothetical protein